MIVELWPLTIKVDVLIVQLINLAILFFIFKKLFGDTLVKEIAKRKEMTKRLEQADEEYNILINKAQEEKNAILEEALAKKNDILKEAKELADQQKAKTIEQAQQDAKNIITQANQEAELKSRDLESHFVQGVKTTALAMVKKLFSSNKNLQESYIEGLVEEFSASYKK